jgi:hypothetical protein
MSSIATRLAIVDSNRRITEKRLRRKTRRIYDAKTEMDRLLVRALRKNQIHNLATRTEKSVTKSGRILFAPVTTFDHKPVNKRTRHYVVEYKGVLPCVYAYTDHGPGRHHARPNYIDLKREGIVEGIVRLYREEITR